MKTIALIIFPNQEIFALPNLVEPREPTHSGFISEEREIMSDYHRQWKEYGEKLKAAIKCDQGVATRILAEQYPDRKIYPHIRKHYNVVNVTMTELCGQEIDIDEEIIPEEDEDEDDWGSREAHYIRASSMQQR